MKTIGTLLLTAIVFAGATAGSWWVNSQRNPQSQDETQTEDSNSSRSANGFEMSESMEEMTVQDRVEGAIQTKPASIEEMVRLGMDLKNREKMIHAEEEKLRQRQIHQQIAFSEIQAEMSIIDELRTNVRSELSTADDLIQRLLQARQAVIDEKNSAEQKLSEVKEVLIEVDGQQQENTKKLAQWIQSMDEKKAAEVLREMSNDGKMSVAVEILSHLEEREAAQILSELDDAKLVQDLVTEFRNLKSPQQTSRGRRATR